MLPNFTGSLRRHGRPLFSILAALAAVAAVSGGLSSAAPGDAAPSAPPGTSDVMLARTALAAIDADPQLRDVNLVVSVVDRVAVIGGPVPTAEHSRRAEDLIRRVPGITEVKNKCFVQAGTDPLLRAIAGRLGPAPRPATTDLPGVVAGPKPGAAGEVVAGPPDGALAMADPPGNPVVARRPSITGDAGGILLPPVAVGPAPVSPPPAPAVLTSVPPAAVPAVIPRPGNVPAAVETLRKGNPRYAGLTVELRDGTLVIAGTAPRAGDAWDFAEAVRTVPGVSRVVVGAVDVR